MSSQIANPYAVSGQWRKAQLHCHTTESDGQITPRDLLQMYREAGYSFVCITDHNRVTRCEDFNDAEFLALPGTEDTVVRWLPPLGPHMIRLLVDEPLRSGTAQERIDRTRASDGIVSLCHPSWNGNLWTGAWQIGAVLALRGFHLFEVCNPHSNMDEDTRRWTAAVQAHGAESPVWAVAVDDCHHRDQSNRGWIMLKTSAVSAEAFRQALLNGAFYATTGPDAAFAVADQTISVNLSNGGRIRFVDLLGRIVSEANGASATYKPGGKEGAVRIDVTSPAGRLWSQPFWITNARETRHQTAVP
ncbi:MAG: PHP domain-containing protein [Gammaproteobacteria bacterium]